jgi:hypothetical protein
MIMGGNSGCLAEFGKEPRPHHLGVSMKMPQNVDGGVASGIEQSQQDVLDTDVPVS